MAYLFNQLMDLRSYSTSKKTFKKNSFKIVRRRYHKEKKYFWKKSPVSNGNYEDYELLFFPSIAFIYLYNVSKFHSNRLNRF